MLACRDNSIIFFAYFPLFTPFLRREVSKVGLELGEWHCQKDAEKALIQFQKTKSLQLFDYEMNIEESVTEKWPRSRRGRETKPTLITSYHFKCVKIVVETSAAQARLPPFAIVNSTKYNPTPNAAHLKQGGKWCKIGKPWWHPPFYQCRKNNHSELECV